MDSDVKIAGNKPSADIRKNRAEITEQPVLDKESISRAKLIGSKVANDLISAAETADNVDDEERNYEMLLQRKLLLSFTAAVGFERYIKDDSLSGIAQKSFLDSLKVKDPELYRASSDSGAFSFYYLAFRRGSEVDRRIGQTFAMLCSHDGDPIYQELGEALYCWFSSEIKKTVLNTI